MIVGSIQNDLFPNEIEEEEVSPPKVLDIDISVCTEEAENNPVSPKKLKKKYSLRSKFPVLKISYGCRMKRWWRTRRPYNMIIVM